MRKLLKVAQGDVILLFIEPDVGSWFCHYGFLICKKWGQCQWPRLLGRLNAVVNVAGLSTVPDTLVIPEWLLLPLWSVKLGNVAAHHRYTGPPLTTQSSNKRLTLITDFRKLMNARYRMQKSEKLPQGSHAPNPKMIFSGRVLGLLLPVWSTAIWLLPCLSLLLLWRRDDLFSSKAAGISAWLIQMFNKCLLN